MQKKIIASAVAAALAAPLLAHADIDLFEHKIIIYGQANVSFDSVRTGTSSAGVGGTTVNKVQSNSSRLGFKGWEDLGNDTSVIWQIEQAINFDTGPGGNDTFTTRDSFAGLENKGLGKIIGGYLSTPYKLSTRDLDQFGDGVADNRSLMGQSFFGSFDGNVTTGIAYFTPDLSGFSGIVGYNNLSPGNVLGTQYDGNGVSIAGIYNMKPLYVTVAYSRNDIASNASNSAVKVGASYTFYDFTVTLVTERVRDNVFGFKGDHNATYLTGRYAFGASAIKAAFTRTGDLKGLADSGANQYSIGYDYSLGKTTVIYALFTKLHNDRFAGYSLASGTALPNVSNGLGSSPSAFSVGMKYAF